MTEMAMRGQATGQVDDGSAIKTTAALHAIAGLAIIGMLAFGLYMVALPKSAFRTWLYNLHNSIGLTILAVALAQAYWRSRVGWPSALTRQSAFEHVAKRVVQWTLVVGTLLMPVTGILVRVGGGWGLKYFGVVLLPFARVHKAAPYPTLYHFAGDAHYWIARILIAALVVHVLATLKHQFVDRDRTLARILGRTT